MLLTVHRILPTVALLFLCSFLDRTNVGNAKTYGLEEDLKITDHQYETALAVFYATYIAWYENFTNRIILFLDRVWMRRLIILPNLMRYQATWS